MKEELAGIIAMCRGAATTPSAKLMVLGKLLTLQAQVVDDAVEVPVDVFEGLDAEACKLIMMCFVTVMVMSLEGK